MYLIDRNKHNYSRIDTNANLTLGISVAVLLCLFVCGLICGFCFGIISSSFLQLLLHKKALSHVINSRALTGEKPCTNKASNALLIHGYATFNISYKGHRIAVSRDVYYPALERA